MVNKRGQTASEFIIVLTLLTFVGVAILYGLRGDTPSGGGAIDKMQSNASNQMSAEKDN